MLSQFFGTRYGAFFRFTPDYVDEAKPPGFSAIPTPSFAAWLRRVPVLLLITPNGLWGTLALLFYFAFPFDLSPDSAAASSPLSVPFFAKRWPLWAALVFGYTGFWHVTLYGLRWAERPFIPGRVYSFQKTAHNVCWSVVGVSVWVCVENVFAFLWSTGRLRFVSDAAAFGSISGGVAFVAALFLVPAWRDVHVRGVSHLASESQPSARPPAAPVLLRAPLAALAAPLRRRPRAASPQHGRRALRRPVHAPGRASVRRGGGAAGTGAAPSGGAMICPSFRGGGAGTTSRACSRRCSASRPPSPSSGTACTCSWWAAGGKGQGGSWGVRDPV